MNDPHMMNQQLGSGPHDIDISRCKMQAWCFVGSTLFSPAWFIYFLNFSSFFASLHYYLILSLSSASLHFTLCASPSPHLSQPSMKHPPPLLSYLHCLYGERKVHTPKSLGIPTLFFFLFLLYLRTPALCFIFCALNVGLSFPL